MSEVTGRVRSCEAGIAMDDDDGLTRPPKGDLRSEFVSCLLGPRTKTKSTA